MQLHDRITTLQDALEWLALVNGSLQFIDRSYTGLKQKRYLRLSTGAGELSSSVVVRLDSEDDNANLSECPAVIVAAQHLQHNLALQEQGAFSSLAKFITDRSQQKGETVDQSGH